MHVHEFIFYKCETDRQTDRQRQRGRERETVGVRESGRERERYETIYGTIIYCVAGNMIIHKGVLGGYGK